VRQGLLSLGAIALLAATGCSGGSTSSSQGQPAPALSGSSTPTSMASVTGGQDLGMYNPYLGGRSYNSAVPPPGRLYGYTQ